ncbi:MAG: DEAD/DEAH box helicase [Tepidisphaerales bacterium]
MRGFPTDTETPAGPVIEPGDRIEVAFRAGPADRLKLVLPGEWRHILEDLRVVETDTGRPLCFKREDDVLIIDASGISAGPGIEAAWIEIFSPGRLRVTLERAVPIDSRETVASGWKLELSSSDAALLVGVRPGASAHEFELGLRAARLATHGGFDKLICLPTLRDMEILDHQVRASVTALRRMRGRAMLCDEVGLGKTVEAGIIVSELLMRGLARSMLVLTPPSLITQWQGEMRRKFGVDLISHDDPAFGKKGWTDHNLVIASIHTAKRDPHRSAILPRKWDIVVIDEAHHLRNRTTQLWKFASELRKQFILLLTATPVQNNLEELFNLVTLLEPGLLSTQRDFQKRFVDRGDKLVPKNVDELHNLLAEVMVRNRRSTVGLQFTSRHARTLAVPLSAGERSLYDSAATFIRDGLRKDDAKTEGTTRFPDNGDVSECRHHGLEARATKFGEPKANPGRTVAPKNELSRMALVTLQMALGSSSSAAASMLHNLLDKPDLPHELRSKLTELHDSAAAQQESAKTDRLLRLLVDFPDKLVVFTQFRATQDMLARRLRDAGIETAVFHGGLSRLEKEASIEQFRESARVLLATESGSEGRNLQFAHGLCNFDLPWNPMKIEQRIGRLSRIGQKHDVEVFNLVASGTIEAAVLHLLEAKLNMFELVIGEVDMILGNLEEEREFEDVVADLWAESASTDEFTARMELLGNRLLAAKVAYFRQKTQDEKLFGNRFAPEG